MSGVEAKARTGEARKIDQPYTSQIKLTAKVNGARGPLFRQHRSKAAIRTLLPRFNSCLQCPNFRLCRGSITSMALSAIIGRGLSARARAIVPLDMVERKHGATC